MKKYGVRLLPPWESKQVGHRLVPEVTRIHVAVLLKY